jgi:DNA-binding NarL/FixJ family response regulator
MTNPRVLLADDHTIVAEGLASILRGEFTLVGTVADGQALLSAAAELVPDVIVTDISMPSVNGLDAMRRLRKGGSTIKFVVLTMHADERLVVESFRAGASAYVLKQSAGEELIAAIRDALAGRLYLTPLIRRPLADVLKELNARLDEPKANPTPRQREVLRLVAEGRTMKEIAILLNISTRTAESHKYDMMRDLGVDTTAELIQLAVKLGLVTPA